MQEGWGWLCTDEFGSWLSCGYQSFEVVFLKTREDIGDAIINASNVGDNYVKATQEYSKWASAMVSE